MTKLIAYAESPDQFVWPQMCVHCGQELDSEGTARIDVKTTKLVAYTFTLTNPKKLPVTLCPNCKHNYLGLGAVKTVGKVLIVSGLVLGASTPYRAAFGAAFFFGIALTALGSGLQRQWLGVRCTTQRKNKWILRLRNPTLVDTFCKLNAPNIDDRSLAKLDK